MRRARGARRPRRPARGRQHEVGPSVAARGSAAWLVGKHASCLPAAASQLSRQTGRWSWANGIGRGGAGPRRDARPRRGAARMSRRQAGTKCAPPPGRGAPGWWWNSAAAGGHRPPQVAAQSSPGVAPLHPGRRPAPQASGPLWPGGRRQPSGNGGGTAAGRPRTRPRLVDGCSNVAEPPAAVKRSGSGPGVARRRRRARTRPRTRPRSPGTRPARPRPQTAGGGAPAGGAARRRGRRQQRGPRRQPRPPP